MPSFLSQCIEGNADDAELEFIHKFAAMSLAMGGADTVSANFTDEFVLMLTLHRRYQLL